MKKNFTLITLLLFIISAAGIFAESRSDKKIEKEFKVKSGQTLKLELKIGADILVEGWDKELLTAEIELDGDDADEVTIDFDESSGGVKIHAYYDGKSKNWKSDGKFKVRVPSKFNVEFETMGGDVALRNIDGELSGTTMGGDLDFNNLKGMLKATTMGGDIKLINSEVDGKVKTMGGDVDLENVIGDVNASSMGGDIKQKNVKRRTGESIGEEANISTMGGDIKLDEAPSGAKVKTMGGDIEINSVKEYLLAETMGGDIKVKDLDGWAEATTMGGDVEIKMTGDPNEGKRDVVMKSLGGDIKLYVPEGLSMDIEIEIKYNENHEDDVEIVSDFDLDEKVEKENKDTMVLTGKGKTGSGKNKIVLKTIGGKVYLKKS